MEHVLQWVVAGIIIIGGPLLTIFDLPGNTLMMLSSVGFAVYDGTRYFNWHLMLAMFIIYVLGECWEFFISFFGIKRSDIPWSVVILIGIGGIIGTIAGTGFFPILGSFIGGVIGAFAVAFIYEYARSGQKENAFELAFRAARTRFLALIGKLAAGFALAVLLVKQVFFI
ncbi:MAG: DUF456 family protein [Phascolarctobacterium sp.]|nr:DUF456 family protein [Phascolarctobacterium sp.]